MERQEGMDISNKDAGQNAMADRNYIHWHAEGVERIPPNETEDIQTVADQINAMQKAQYNMHRHCYTGQNNTSTARHELTDTQAPMPAHRALSKARSSYLTIYPDI